MVLATTLVEDVLALVFLSVLTSLAGASGPPGAADILRPLGVSLGAALVLGAAATRAVPPALARLTAALPGAWVGPALVGLLFAAASGLAAGLSRAGASPLLGAFLAGVCFCTVPAVPRLWRGQVKRLARWLSRLFFAATLGFRVPLPALRLPAVWRAGLVLYCATLGKLLAGLCASGRGAPEAVALGLAASCMGEFSLIVASSAAHELRLLTSETYAAVALAALLTMLVSPCLLGRALAWAERRAAAAAAEAASPAGASRVYWKLDGAPARRSPPAPLSARAGRGAGTAGARAS